VDIQDAGLARVVRRCQELPGQELFQYVTDEGKRQAVNSEDVNDYLGEISGEDFSAKDFRTWAGTMLTAVALSGRPEVRSQSQAKKNLVEAVKQVSQRLGNTPAVCRKCYIHPDVLDSYLNGMLHQALGGCIGARRTNALRKLRPIERAVLRLLEEHLRAAERPIESVLEASLKRESGRRRRSSRPHLGRV